MKLCSKCGKNPRRKSHSWCQPCHNEGNKKYAAAYQRRYMEKNRERDREKNNRRNRKYVAAYAARNREKLNRLRREWERAHPAVGAARERKLVRLRANKAVQTGKLIPQPCQVCGADAEMHHPDYGRPYDVEWLCRAHHLELHRQETGAPGWAMYQQDEKTGV